MKEIEKEKNNDNKIIYRRIKTIDTLNGSAELDYELPEHESGEYVVDDTNFVPVSEAIKQLKGSNMTSEEIAQSFDFPTGKDTGISIPISRSHDIKDIAEISQEIMNQTDKISEEIIKGKKIQSDQISFENKVNNIVKSSE